MFSVVLLKRIKKKNKNTGMVKYAFSPSTREIETGEFEASLVYKGSPG